jgi:hypothetical protein
MRRILVALVVLLSACNNTSTDAKSSLSSLDSNTANNTLAVNTDEIIIQPFTQLPSIINNCSALFSMDSGNLNNQYVFVSNLKGIAFIKLNNRLMELRLVKQTNIDKFTVNELYVNDEIEVDLKIKQLGEKNNIGLNYTGVLIVNRGGKREALSISGKLGC